MQSLPQLISLLPKSIKSDGWLEPVRRLPSPNYSQRPDGFELNLLVVHNISLPPEQFGGGYIESFFLNQLDSSIDPYFSTIEHMQVSAHCLISREGVATQFVSFLDRAWHAGESCYRGRSDCNDFSIGIELEGADNTAYTAQQYTALTAITQLIMRAYPAIKLECIVGHCDIAPDRKTDPGPAFDWKYFRGLLEGNACT